MRILVVALCLAGAVAMAADLEREYVLPTEACGDYYFVQMAVNGDPDRMLSMLLDTGASHSVIDVDAFERVSGHRIDIGRNARFAELVAGEVKFKGVRAEVLRLDHLELVIGKPLDGILGFPTFRKLLLTIDYPRGEVRVRSGSLPRPDGKRILPTVKERRRPVVRMSFGDRDRPVLLDSGAWGGFILRDAAALRFVSRPVEYDSSLRIDRVMMKSGARLIDDIQFGAATLRRPTIQLAQSTDLVGSLVMRHFSITFDQKRGRVLLERSDDEPIEFPPMRDFGWAVRPKPDGFEIVRVFENLGAERAGLLAGDFVVAIDGTPVYERDLCAREREERSEVPVSVVREGERLELRVPVDTVVP